MTTHLRARALQAGAFLALIGGVLVAAPSPAAAADPDVSVISAQPDSIPVGGTTTVRYQVLNAGNPPGEDVSVEVTAESMSCSGDCRFDDDQIPATGKTFTAVLKHTGNVEAGEQKPIRVEVRAQIGSDRDSDGRQIIVRGADKPQTVRQVSGRVKDQDGKAVSGALVGLRDSQNHQYQTNTNGDGGYSFTSSDSKPISVGAMAVGATKDGYEIASVNAQGTAGKSINVPLTLKSKATPTKSNSPSPSPSVSTEPTDEATDEATEPATDESAAVLDAAPKSAEDEGSGSLLFIILGGLLVAAGIGAIVLVLMRRKSAEDPDELDGAAAAGAVPAAAGRYGGADQTRLAAPVGGGVSDATMIAPRSGAPSIADAPTMIHHTAPPVDEFPDPYGAPMPPGGGYNAPGGWGTADAAGAAGAAGAYGAATQYGGAPAPAQHGGYADQDDHGYADNGYGPGQPAYGEPGYDEAGYGAAPGGYQPPAQRYDEPTGMYRPEPSGGYPPEAGYPEQGGYGGYPQGGDEYAGPGQPAPYQGGNGYQGGAYGAAAEPADPAGYGGWDGAAGGIDSGNAYGPPAGGGTYGGAQGGGTYGAPGGAQPYGGGAAGAYGAPAGGGYGGEPEAYDPRATYGRPEGYDQPGAGRGQQPPPGGYGDHGGYPAAADQTGYYGGPEQGGRHGGQPRQQPPEGNRPAQRRPSDWED